MFICKDELLAANDNLAYYPHDDAIDDDILPAGAEQKVQCAEYASGIVEICHIDSHTHDDRYRHKQRSFLGRY